MVRYLGRHTPGIDQRTGRKVKYKDLVEDGENRGLLVAREERDAEHPQKFARRVPLDRLNIRRPSPEPMIGAVTVIGNSGGSSDLWEGNQTALHLSLIMGEVVVTPTAEVRPANQVAPVITGTPREGETLTTSDGQWTNTPTSFAYQWYGNGVAIPGATSSTYDLVFADVGTLITSVVTASNGGGSVAQVSDAVGPILQALPVNTVLPVITGTPEVGETLTVDNGTWDNTPILSYAYQWTSDGANIPGATSSSYLVTTDYAGTEIRAVVTATNAGGSASATADPVSIAQNLEALSNDIVLTGRDVWLKTGRKLLVTTSDIAVAGSSILLKTARKLYPTSKNIAVAGQSVTLTKGISGPQADFFGAISVTNKRGFSVARRIHSSYSGALFRVKRSSDNTEQDIGVDGNGLMDEASLLSFVGAGNGWVVDLYNQLEDLGGGLSNYSDSQNVDDGPLIVESGVLNTLNGSPAMRFDGTKTLNFNTGSNNYLGASSYSWLVGCRPTALADRAISWSTESRHSFDLKTGPVFRAAHLGTGGYDLPTVSVAAVPFNAVLAVRWTGSDVIPYYNGTAGTVEPGTNLTSNGVFDIPYLGGDISGSIAFQGYVSEIVATTSGMSTSDMNTVGSGMSQLTGTSWTTIT